MPVSLSFFILSYFVDPVSRQSVLINPEARLTLQGVMIGGYNTVIPLGIILAVIAVVAMHLLINHTRFGFELKAVGSNNKAAKYAGIRVNSNIMKAMMLSGALAGLAGATYYLGYLGSIQPRVLADTGFDAIAVCLLGNSNPIGIVFSSFLITIITKGGIYMNSAIGVNQEISSLITGLMLLFAACGVYIRYRLNKAQEAQLEAEKNKLAAEAALDSDAEKGGEQ